MDPLEAWVDAAAVKRLAAQLLERSSEPEVVGVNETGFGADFEGFERRGGMAPPPVPVFQAVVEEEKAAPSPVVVSVEEPVAEVRPTRGEAAAPERRGPLLDRLGRFRDRLVEHTGAQGVFVLDREGRPVMEDPHYAKLHFLARSLAKAYRPVAGQAGNVHVKIGAASVLEVIPVETPFGCLVLGAVLPRPLVPSLVQEVAAALRQAATPPEHG